MSNSYGAPPQPTSLSPNSQLPSPTSTTNSDDSKDSDQSQFDKNNNYGTKTPSGNPRIYNCQQCNRAFTREEHLTRHTLSTHNKLKPFTCGICSRPFSRRDLLLRHAKNLHQGSELAVSRIRKSFKRNDINQYQHPDGTIIDGVDLNDNDDDLDNESSLSSNSSVNNSPTLKTTTANTSNLRRSIDNSDLSSTLTATLISPVNSGISRNNGNNNNDQTISNYSASSSSTITNNTTPVNSSNSSSPNNTTSSSNKKSKKNYESPEKKRLKISVNMLVS
ncbi:hypothetical protein DFJ63DRAFT_334644 [Scheffersomyces coipomensis]|uniref:uncharacterized protein n=1 Tax=Scheffersomyces coipomensis TaxID=1788519 RepID=UPI00315CF774